MILKIQQNIIYAKKIVWNPSTCACEIKRYLKDIAHGLIVNLIKLYMW